MPISRRRFRGNGSHATTFRPTVCLLEDRLVPTTLFRVLAPPIVPATHFQVLVPTSVQVGQAFNVTVTALDATNHTASGYTGTIHFSLGTADPSATLPVNYTFAASAQGVHTFQLTLAALGSQTIHVTDTHSLTGVGSIVVAAPPVVTHFVLVTPTSVSPGVPTNVTVQALDATNHIVTGYTGTVHFSSTDSNALLPSDYTFVASDKGSHLFSVVFATPGQQTLSTLDVSGGTSGTGSIRVLSPLSFNPNSFGSGSWGFNGVWNWNWNWAMLSGFGGNGFGTPSWWF